MLKCLARQTSGSASSATSWPIFSRNLMQSATVRATLVARTGTSLMNHSSISSVSATPENMDDALRWVVHHWRTLVGMASQTSNGDCVVRSCMCSEDGRQTVASGCLRATLASSPRSETVRFVIACGPRPTRWIRPCRIGRIGRVRATARGPRSLRSRGRMRPGWTARYRTS